MEVRPPALGARHLNHWTTSEVLQCVLMSHMTTLFTPLGKVADVNSESLLSLLSGSEGKLTIVAQKMSVLSGIEFLFGCQEVRL